MLQKFELKGVHTTIDDSLEKYVHRKLGRLDKYLPHGHRDSAHAIVELKESKSKKNDKYTCSVLLHLPHGAINVSESTMNMYAAVDIVEARLKASIKKYKDQHANGKLYRKLAARFRRQSGLAEPVEPQPEV